MLNSVISNNNFTVNHNFNRIVKIDALIWFDHNFVAVKRSGLLNARVHESQESKIEKRKGKTNKIMRCNSMLALVQHTYMFTLGQAADETVAPNYQHKENVFFHYLIAHKKLTFSTMQETHILLLTQLLHWSILAELVISECRSETLRSNLQQLMLRTAFLT